MLRRLYHGTLGLALLVLLNAATQAGAEDKKPDPDAEKAARDALVQFDKGWEEYTNEPNLGDPRWKLKMEVRVRLAQAGPAAFPLLEEVAKEGSPWFASTREFAEASLRILRKEELRKGLADYDLAQMDSARVGKSAPDFALQDATGKTYRLTQFRGKIVVLAFIVFDL